MDILYRKKVRQLKIYRLYIYITYISIYIYIYIYIYRERERERGERAGLQGLQTATADSNTVARQRAHGHGPNC